MNLRSLLCLLAGFCLLPSAFCLLSSIQAGPDTAAVDEALLHDAKIGTDAPALLDFFRNRTATEATLNKVKVLIQQLGDDSFQTRQKASAELPALGPVALPLLRQALKDTDVEVVRRAEECIRNIEQGYGPGLAPAAARLLALRKPPEAVEVLLTYLPSAEDEGAAEEVRTALAALALRDGKPDPLLVAALEDKMPARRAAAGAALYRAHIAELRPAVRKLLEDPDPAVRLRVGLALIAAKEKEAVPVLIGLLGEMPSNQLWQVDDLLYRLADDKAPMATAGADEASRRKYREAWLAWWKEHGEKIDLTKLDQEPTILGYTMVIMLDAGRLLEMDANNKERWHIDGLQFPLDAQYLPGDRVLVAENQGNRVTERNLKGEVLWEKKIDMPVMAQRLPNGHTFVGTRTQLVEFDREGKQVFSYARPNGELFMRAKKLRNGEIACVTSNYQFLRLDPTFKELQSFPVDIQTFGGRIEVLPNGNVLVPEYTNNKVVERDAKGQAVWEVPFEKPIVALRLGNGNTLVTSLNQLRAVEIDRAGKQVWEFKADSRVTRAWRR
jgi:HEAT repeat protein